MFAVRCTALILCDRLTFMNTSITACDSCNITRAKCDGDKNIRGKLWLSHLIVHRSEKLVAAITLINRDILSVR